MTPTEKKYFKRSLNDRADGKIKSVFDAINGLEKFDQKELNKRVRATYSDSTAAYNQVITIGLRLLSQYNSKTWTEVELNSLLTQARFALERKLIPIYEKLVEKGLKMAEENDLESYRYMFMEMSMMPGFELVNADLDHYRQVKERMISSTDVLKLSAEIDFQRLRHMWMQTWTITTKENWESFGEESKKLYQYDVQNYIDEGHILVASRLLLLRSANHFVLGDWDGALKECQTAVAVMGDPVKLPYRIFLAWGGHMRNILNLAKVLGKREVFLKTYEELPKAFVDRGLPVPPFIEHRLRLHHVGHLAHCGQLTEALVEFDKLIEERSPYLNMSELRSEKVYILFMMEDHRRVLEEVNTLLVEQDMSLDAIMVRSLRWLESFSAFMLQDEILFEAKLRAQKRLLQKQSSGFEWEASILGTLKKAFNKTQEEQMHLFSDLHDELIDVKEQVRSCFSVFDPFSWIGSRAEGASESDYWKSRYN